MCPTCKACGPTNEPTSTPYMPPNPSGSTTAAPGSTPAAPATTPYMPPNPSGSTTAVPSTSGEHQVSRLCHTSLSTITDLAELAGCHGHVVDITSCCICRAWQQVCTTYVALSSICLVRGSISGTDQLLHCIGHSIVLLVTLQAGCLPTAAVQQHPQHQVKPTACPAAHSPL